jgi:LysM repeat protein
MRQNERRHLAERVRFALRIGGLVAAVAALGVGIVLVGGGSRAAAALSSSVVPDDLPRAAVTLPDSTASIVPTVEFERTEDVEYVVGDGETLSEIADSYDLSYETLAEYNDLTDPNTLRPGQRIMIPSVDALPAEVAAAPGP